MVWMYAGYLNDIHAAERERSTRREVITTTHWQGRSSGSRMGLPHKYSATFVRYGYSIAGKTYERSGSNPTFIADGVLVYYDRVRPERSSLVDFQDLGDSTVRLLYLMSLALVWFLAVVGINLAKRKHRPSQGRTW